MISYAKTGVDVLKKIQKYAGINEREMFQTFNMGIGFVVITKNPKKALKVAKKHKINAWVLGKTTSKKGTVEIKPKNLLL